MVDIDIDRAWDLLASARTLFEAGDFTGVSGLSYQAFESASIALLEVKNGKDKKSHLDRRERIKQLLTEYNDRIDRIWTLRNIDFYGNIRMGDKKRNISQEEAEDCLNTVEDIIERIEEMLE